MSNTTPTVPAEKHAAEIANVQERMDKVIIMCADPDWGHILKSQADDVKFLSSVLGELVMTIPGVAEYLGYETQVKDSA